MKKVFILLTLVCFTLFTLLAEPVQETVAPEVETILFTDSSGRTVEITKGLTKIAPSGAVATMMLSALAPEYMTNVNSTPSESQMAFLPAVLATLPPTGQLYGSKATLNAEEIIATGAEIIIDLGDYKKGIAEDLDALQTQTGIPCIFLSADLEHMAEAFRSLGLILKDKADRAEELASFIDKTMAMAKENAAKVKPEEVLTVMYTSGKDGLGTNAEGSSQAQVIGLVGAKNAIVVEKVSSKGGGNQINMEQLYNFNPNVILFAEGSIFKSVGKDELWTHLDAIQSGRFYEIPCTPYNWMSNPPSMNMVLGIWWLGNLLYPQYFDYNMSEVTKEAYGLFWNYKLSDEEVQRLLLNSTGK